MRLTGAGVKWWKMVVEVEVDVKQGRIHYMLSALIIASLLTLLSALLFSSLLALLSAQSLVALGAGSNRRKL